MSEASSEARQVQSQRRANWVGLRTLRQRPKLVGQTAGGDPIYEIRSIRLLLPSASAHFTRLVSCARCGKEMSGAPVLNAIDLDRVLRPTICHGCVRSAGVSSRWDPAIGRPAGERVIDQAPDRRPVAPEDEEAVVGGSNAVADSRLDRMERALAALVARVDDLAGDVRASADVRRELSSVADDWATREASLRAQVRHDLSGLTGAVKQQSSDMEAVVSALSKASRDVEWLGQGHQRLAEAQEGFQRQMDSLVAQVVGLTARAEVVADMVADGRARLLALEGTVHSTVESFVASVDGGADDSKSGAFGASSTVLDALDVQLRRASGRLAALAEGDRVESLVDPRSSVHRSQDDVPGNGSVNGGPSHDQ